MPELAPLLPKIKSIFTVFFNFKMIGQKVANKKQFLNENCFPNHILKNNIPRLS